MNRSKLKTQKTKKKILFCGEIQHHEQKLKNLF